MAFDLPTQDDLLQLYLDAYQAQFPERSVARGTDGWRLGKVAAFVSWSILGRFVQLERNMLPDQCDEDTLIRWATFYAVPRRGAQPSHRTQALRVTGTPGATVPLHAELVAVDGTLYEIAQTAVVGGGGTVDCDVQSISKGLVTCKRAGEQLTFTTPPVGISAAADLVLDLVDGTDMEELEIWRNRVLLEVGAPREGGAVNDYIKWALAEAGVARAYLYRHRRALGTLDLVVLAAGRGAARVLPDLIAVTAAIEARRPAGAPDFLVLTAVPQPQDVVIQARIDSQLARWDWDDGGAGPSVTAANPGASTITLNTLPSSLRVGCRLQIAGEEAKVTAIAGMVLTLVFAAPATWFSSTPVGGTVEASGDVVVPARERVLALFDALGPARVGAQQLSYAATSWEDTLGAWNISTALKGVLGLTDARVVTPGANVAPVDSFGTSVPFLVPGTVRVVRMP